MDTNRAVLQEIEKMFQRNKGTKIETPLSVDDLNSAKCKLMWLKTRGCEESDIVQTMAFVALKICHSRQKTRMQENPPLLWVTIFRSTQKLLEKQPQYCPLEERWQ